VVNTGLIQQQQQQRQQLVRQVSAMETGSAPMVTPAQRLQRVISAPTGLGTPPSDQAQLVQQRSPGENITEIEKCEALTMFLY
jgi:hypothetical protein